MDRRRAEKAERRNRLKANVDKIIRKSRTPLRDIVRDLVLHYLPVRSLLRCTAVATDWNHVISTPIFRHFQSRTHRTASGVFQHSLPDVPAYFPFDHLAGGIPDPFLSFLPIPAPFAIVASSNGLLCCAGFDGSYYVCNPSTTEWAALPEAPLSELGNSHRIPVEALVFETSGRNLGENYWLVRGCHISDDCPGVYGFQVFSSETGEWQISSERHAVEELIVGSGVSAGGVAYWRTSTLTTISYNPATDSCSIIPWPTGDDPSAEWQLGEINGRLCCTRVTDNAVEVYSLTLLHDWALLGSFRIINGEEEDDDDESSATLTPVFRSRPRPLRFQSREPEVLLWLSGGIVGLDIEKGRLRKACLPPDHPWTSPYADHVPHISTFARVFKFF